MNFHSGTFKQANQICSCSALGITWGYLLCCWRYVQVKKWTLHLVLTYWLVTNAIEQCYFGIVHPGCNHTFQLSATSSASCVLFCGFSKHFLASFTIRLNWNLEYIGTKWSDNEQSFGNLAVFKSLPVDEESVASQQLWGQQPTHAHSAQAAVLRQPAATRVVPGHHHCFDTHNVAVTAKHIDSGGKSLMTALSCHGITFQR